MKQIYKSNQSISGQTNKILVKLFTKLKCRQGKDTEKDKELKITELLLKFL